MADDHDNKTEPGSQKRRAEAREKGQVAISRDVSTVASMAAGVTALMVFAPVSFWRLQDLMREWFARVGTPQTVLEDWPTMIRDIAIEVVGLVLPFSLVVLVVSVGATMAQTRFLWSLSALKPNWNRLNPWEGCKRLLSLRAAVELVKSVGKIILIAGAGIWAIRADWPQVIPLANYDLTNTLTVVGQLSLVMWWAMIGAASVLAAADYMYQRYEFEKSLRMTKQEVRDEQKESEGDPGVKARVRSVQKELRRRRMMQAVPQADVIVTNPYHLAVALQYKPGMAAPKVLAKGAGYLAEKIKSIAREHGIPVLENKPVARALFRTVQVGQDIPAELYQAVAEILAIIFRTRPSAPTES